MHQAMVKDMGNGKDNHEIVKWNTCNGNWEILDKQVTMHCNWQILD